MCGRYSWAQKKVSTQLEKLEVPPPPTSVSYNRAPGQEHPVVIKTTKKTDWSMAKWGIIPSQKLASSRLNPINARIETVREKSIFPDSLLHRRCLVPADGYFEWQKIDSQKYPYFHYLTNQHMFAMAGIWNETKKEEGCVRSFSVLTQPASPNLLHIHHRMPVIINPQDWSDWLDNDSQLDHLLSYYSQPKQTLNVHQVASKVNHVKNDGPDLIIRFTEKQSTLW